MVKIEIKSILYINGCITFSLKVLLRRLSDYCMAFIFHLGVKKSRLDYKYLSILCNDFRHHILSGVNETVNKLAIGRKMYEEK